MPSRDTVLADKGTALGAAAIAGAASTVPESRPRIVREAALILSLFLLYRLARLAITGHDSLAIENAWWIWDVERATFLPDEEVLQDWALQWPDLLKAANWYYVGVHFPATLAFLVWSWWRRPAAEYRWARRLIIVLTGLALIGHVLMPLAPPRMLTSLGFLDTMATFGPSAYAGGAASVANQVAAMPSLHVGWALLIAVVVGTTTTSRWRWVVMAHPVITILVVVVTANHYWLDAAAAAALLALALLATPTPTGPAPLLRRWRARRTRATEPDATSLPPRPRTPAD